MIVPNAVARSQPEFKSQNLARVKGKSNLPDTSSQEAKPLLLLAQSANEDFERDNNNSSSDRTTDDESAIVPAGDREIITKIEVRFVDDEGNSVEGKTQP
ncbi:MAG: hypothetical protein AAFR63_15720, partial [Cyanobacteria bacterium J06631_6]